MTRMAGRILGRTAMAAAAALALCVGVLPALARRSCLVGATRLMYPGETIDLAALKEVTLKPPARWFRA